MEYSVTAMTPTNQIHIGILGFHGVQLLDIVGPLETFLMVKNQKGESLYRCSIVGPEKEFKSESNVSVKTDFDFPNAPHFDLLIIPGGAGTRDPAIQQVIEPWLAKQVNHVHRLLTVCTGIFFIAHLPFLAGKQVTTHWDFVDKLQSQFPNLLVDRNRLFIQQDNFYSSAGVLSGIDLALHIIEQDHGLEQAVSAAKYLVTYLKRSGNQSQFSEALKFQSINNDRILNITNWLMNNIDRPITVQQLAFENHVSERHLNRIFKSHCHMTAKSYVEHIRLEQAKIFLQKQSTSVKQVAYQVGYNSDDSFRRSFKRKYGIEPSSYQRYFS